MWQITCHWERQRQRECVRAFQWEVLASLETWRRFGLSLTSLLTFDLLLPPGKTLVQAITVSCEDITALTDDQSPADVQPGTGPGCHCQWFVHR